MLNLIYLILISVAYDIPVLDTDAVIWLLSCCLYPLVLHYGAPVVMNAMVVIFEMRAWMIIHSSPYVIVLKINNIKYSLLIINIIRIQC